MMSWKQFEYFYWTVLNFLVRRVMGVLWLLVGIIASLWSLVVLFDSSASIDIQGVPATDASTKLLGVAVSLFVLLFGWFFLRVPKYYPRKIHEWMREDLSQ